MRKIIASLDIGTFEIKLLVGEIVKNKVNILANICTPARGIKHGYIVNSESAIESLNDAFKKAEDMIGIKPDKVILSVPAFGTECFISEGYTSITNEKRIITGADIIRALQSTIYNNIDKNRELVTIQPTKFIINDANVVDNPLHMKGEKLYVKAVIVTVPKSNVANLTKCLEKLNIKVVDIALGSLGDYYNFEDKNKKNKVGAVVNIGASKIDVAIFNKGILTSTEVIEIGGSNIDNDLSYVYKISKKDALYLKEALCIADKNIASPKESLIFVDNHDDKLKINQYDASEVVIKRLEEILKFIKKQINLLTKKEISYIIVTGGVTETSYFKNLVDSNLNNAIIGDITLIGVRHNKYSTSLGLIKYYDSRLKLYNKDFSIYDIDEQEELSGMHKKMGISENSILGKLFGYFFDN